MLGSHLEESAYEVVYAEADADILILKTAVEYSNQINTVLVGDDTDLLVLLIYYFPQTQHDLFFKPEKKSHVKKDRRTWDIRKQDKN